MLSSSQAFGLLLLVPLSLAGQGLDPAAPAASDSIRRADSLAALQRKPPPVEFSGIIFGAFQYRTAPEAVSGENRFDVERAYLNFRAPAGERTSVRITADLFQQTTPGSDSYYRGWSLRAKYAYLQYEYVRKAGWGANARVGLLPTVFIEQDERFWPRWISNSPTERAGYFSSADAGLSTIVTLPGRRGEIYAAVTNGPGYTSRETDRFKDYAARATFTPFAAQPAGILRSLALTAWTYEGAVASRFVSGGPGQIGTVGSALGRDRRGLHAGLSAPAIVAGVNYARRYDEGESGANTPESPRVVIDSTGSLAGAYVIARPALAGGGFRLPLSLLARYERVTANVDQPTRSAVRIVGALWELSSRASLSLDHQQTRPLEGSAPARSAAWFLHFVATY